MSWIIDAIKEPFTKKEDKKAETKEDKLKEIEELKKMIEKEEQKLKTSEIKVVNVEEIPLPPKFEEEQEIEVTTEQRLQILEQNINVVITDLHTRITAIESYLFRTK